ncbi:hypothetical protein J4403_02155 [Candidatus Woesearchaeota archaeon]|nr:hypothetical protein [Candidatus Woesearchaeota archaeon]
MIGISGAEVATNATELLQQANLGDAATILVPIADKLQMITDILQLFLGGVFGAYLLFLILKWLSGKKLNKNIKNIKLDIEEIKKDLEIIKKNTQKSNKKKK